jgi:hypothetical protein
MSDETREKKIIIDEDWKARVEAEREQLAKEQKSGSETRSANDPDMGKMPPASFHMLITTLASEAMVGLGQIPHPAIGQPNVNLAQAKFFIDTLDVLAEKTRGNLTPSEEGALTQLLHQLRLAFVAVQNAPRGETPVPRH